MEIIKYYGTDADRKEFILDLANAISLSGDNGNSKYNKLPYIPLDKEDK